MRLMTFLLLPVFTAGCGTPDSPVGNETFVSAPGVTADLAAAATITGILDTPFVLQDGDFQGKPYVAGASSRPLVLTLPGSSHVADLDGDGQDEATAVFFVNLGGSGSFLYLVVIDMREGIAQNVATAALGDRAVLKVLSVDDGKIVLDTVEHGDHDPMCCPTTAWRRAWEFGNGDLTQVMATPMDYAASIEKPTSSTTRRYRGTVVWGHETRSFTECSSAREAWISVAPGSDLADSYRQLATEPYQPLYMEVDAIWTKGPGEGFGADFQNSMLVYGVRRAEREGFGCDQKADGFLYRARGNEPSWRLDLRDDLVEFVSMDGEQTYLSPEMRTGADTVYVSVGEDNARIELLVVAERCVDSMSGSVFAYSATVDIGDRQLTGCAIDGF